MNTTKYSFTYVNYNPNASYNVADVTTLMTLMMVSTDKQMCSKCVPLINKCVPYFQMCSIFSILEAIFNIIEKPSFTSVLASQPCRYYCTYMLISTKFNIPCNHACLLSRKATMVLGPRLLAQRRGRASFLRILCPRPQVSYWTQRLR